MTEYVFDDFLDYCEEDNPKLTFGEREIPHPLGVGMKANK